MGTHTHIQDWDNEWEDGRLGQDESHAELASSTPEKEKALDDALQLQLISVRLQKSLIEGLKVVAASHGIGYQPLMRQVLKRFVDSETQRFMREELAALRHEAESQRASEAATTDEPSKKVA